MVTSLFASSSSTSLPSLPSFSSNSKKSTYIPRYDSTTSTATPISPSSPSSSNNTQHTSPLPSASKNSRTRSSHNSRHAPLPSPMVSFAATTTPSPPESPATSSAESSSRSHSGKSSPSFHSMASLTPSMASSSYTQKIARREKRHFQSPSASSTTSSSTSGKSSGQNSKKGGVTFSPSQPLSFLNRSAPVSSSSVIAQPASTAKPKDRFLSRSSLPFTARSSSSSSPSSPASSAKSPLVGTSAPATQPTPKIATAHSNNNNNSNILRASLRNRISTWASSVRQSFTAAHSQDNHSSNSASLPAPISPSTPTMRVNPNPLFPLPSESHSALPVSLPLQELSTPRPTPTTSPILLFSSKEDLADMTTSSSSSSSSLNEAIEGGTRTNLATTGNGVTPLSLLPLVQETDKPAAKDEDIMTRRHHSQHLHPSALPYSPPSTPTPPKLHVQTTTLTPKYPIPAAAATSHSTAHYTPLSASGRSKPRNPFTTTPTAAAAPTIKAETHTFQPPLERARFLNASRSRKVGSGLITIFCIAAIVILILC